MEAPLRSAQLQAIADKITADIFALWWNHAKQGTDDVVSHIGHTFPVLVSRNGCIRPGVSLLNHIEKLLQSNNPHTQRLATLALAQVGPAAAREDLLDGLAGLMEAGHPSSHSVIRAAVASLGEAAAQEGFLRRVLRSLQSDDPAIRRSAAGVVHALGKAAAKGFFIDRLVVMLTSGDERERTAASWAIGGIGEDAYRTEMPPALTNMMQARYQEEQLAAAWAAEGLGAIAGAEAVVSALEKMLESSDKEIYRAAASALQRIGVPLPGDILYDPAEQDSPPIPLSTKTEHKQDVSLLIQALNAPQYVVRRTAARALRHMMTGKNSIRIFHRGKKRFSIRKKTATRAVSLLCRLDPE